MNVVAHKAEKISTQKGLKEELEFWVTKLLQHDDESVIEAAMYLGAMGEKAERTLDSLFLMAKENNPEVREAVIAAIGRINARPFASIPVLLSALEDKNVNVRQKAAAGLGLFDSYELSLHKPHALFDRLLKDEDYVVRFFVYDAMGRL
ncbi:MAG: HEAT repeat domain-containing protein [Gammaproteobacteria bacterium]|nr:HEAT repeat domain-containing protein [Gammaproteobacteria bacterium]